MSPHKSSSRTAISDASVKGFSKLAGVDRASKFAVDVSIRPTIPGDYTFIKMHRAVLLDGITLSLSLGDQSKAASVLVGFLSGALESIEPKIAAQLWAIANINASDSSSEV